jgi:hypothetical protein
LNDSKFGIVVLSHTVSVIWIAPCTLHHQKPN